LKQVLDDNGLHSVSGLYALNNFMLPGKTDDDLKQYVDQCKMTNVAKVVLTNLQ
jgi:MoaA/NifB/PqqE/SkfB family radical SAM enzyme